MTQFHGCNAGFMSTPAIKLPENESTLNLEILGLISEFSFKQTTINIQQQIFGHIVLPFLRSFPELGLDESWERHEVENHVGQQHHAGEGEVDGRVRPHLVVVMMMMMVVVIKMMMMVVMMMMMGLIMMMMMGVIIMMILISVLIALVVTTIRRLCVSGPLAWCPVRCRGSCTSGPVGGSRSQTCNVKLQTL